MPFSISANIITAPDAILKALHDAILNKRKVIFTYQGKSRFVYPVLIGITTKVRVVLQAYQKVVYDGTGVVDDGEGWRYFYLDGISNLMESTEAPDMGFQAILGEQPLNKREQRSFIQAVLIDARTLP